MRFAAALLRCAAAIFSYRWCVCAHKTSPKITAATAQIATNASLVALRVSMYFSCRRFRRLWSSVFDFEVVKERTEREKRIHCVSKQKRLQNGMKNVKKDYYY